MPTKRMQFPEDVNVREWCANRSIERLCPRGTQIDAGVADCLHVWLQIEERVSQGVNSAAKIHEPILLGPCP